MRASVTRDDGSRLGASTQAWLADTLRLTGGRARAQVENATLVDPEDGELRLLGRALVRGDVSVAHVDVARQALTRIPVGLRRTHRERIDTLLAREATRFTAADFRKISGHLVAVLAPAREDRLDPLAAERQQVSCWRDSTGMVQISGQLAGEGGLLVKTVLDHLAAPERVPGSGEDQTLATSNVDARSPGQRTADALVEMARLASTHPGVGTRGAEAPRLVVHATVDQLAWVPDAGGVPPGLATCEGGGALSPGLLQRVACDAVIQTVVLDAAGAIVEMREPGRLANRAQRRALAARDGGCAFPGCSAPPTWCDAHHVVWWSRGGKTVLSNLVLLCSRHHTLIHAGEWVVEMHDGVPWFVPPRHIDPAHVPIRNTVHAAIAETTQLAQQLWRDLGPPGGRSPTDDRGPSDGGPPRHPA